MNLHLHSYTSVLGIILVAQRLLYGLYACSRRAKHHRTAALCGVFGIKEICVYGLFLLVERQFHEVTVNLVGAIFVGSFLCIFQRNGPHVLNVLVPEVHKVGGLLCVRSDFVYRESHLYVMFVGLAVNRGLQSEVAEARSLSRSHVNCGPSAGEFHRAFLVSLQHVVGYFVVHLAVSRYAVFIQLHLNLSLFARLIEPVGMVGHGQPQIVRAVRIVFGCGI